MPKIGVVIPHRGRDEILLWNLRELQKQSLRDFETIVVVDDTQEIADGIMRRMWDEFDYGWHVLCSEGRGPAAARNTGAGLASSDIILFVGSDCIPDRHLLAYHLWYHTQYKNVQIVQGYTPWHPDVITPFYDFLDYSGLQANWNALRDDKGNWLRDINANFCLTTNYSIKKQLQLNEPFDESFTGAAWEDIERAYRLARRHERAIFAHEAVNYHYHSYDVESFAARCRMEGYHRLSMCSLHPELAWNYLSPEQLRAVKDIDVGEMMAWASEFSDTRALSDSMRRETYDRMGQMCTAQSFLGIWDRIEEEPLAMQALPWTNSPEELINVVSGVAAMKRGEHGYSSHTKEWMLTSAPNNWASWAYAGEVELELGHRLEAINAFRRASVIDPGQEWPKRRLEALNER